MNKPPGFIGRSRNVVEKNFKALRSKCGVDSFGQSNLDNFVAGITEYFANKVPDDEDYPEHLEVFRHCIHTLCKRHDVPNTFKLHELAKDVLGILKYNGRRILYRENIDLDVPVECFSMFVENGDTLCQLKLLNGVSCGLMEDEREVRSVILTHIEPNIPRHCFQNLTEKQEETFINEVMMPISELVVQCMRNVAFQKVYPNRSYNGVKVYEPHEYDQIFLDGLDHVEDVSRRQAYPLRVFEEKEDKPHYRKMKLVA